ncbi:MAG: tetratricopeptide repeat protein, partial [Chloroflexota bacterium]
GDLEHAERLFQQVAEADPRNAIAVVGLAKVAAARGDHAAAAELAQRALTIDPDEAAALRLVAATREGAGGADAAASEPTSGVAASEPTSGVAASEPRAPVASAGPLAGPPADPPARRSLLGWIRSLLGLGT